MKLKQTRLHILHQAKDLSKEAKTGVSLHCHTEYSKEMLDFVPHYADKLPIISYFWNKEREKYLKREGKNPDFSTGYWSPPLTPQEVYNIEKSQINEVGLDAITSITDHDSIDANLQICEKTANQQAPISLEWTVPFEYGFFHVGVHNLPKERAVELIQTLLDFTFNKENHSSENLREMFSMLNALPEVLVVLNHPIWDIEMVGKERHAILLKNFLKEHGRWIHALEINGFRSWSENKTVIEMAEALGYPLVTGGDRHGCKPNTVINLTDSKTFAEFVEEIRVGKRSEVVLMPEYKQPLHSRQLQSFSEILRNYPEFPEGRQKWFDRVFFDIGDGGGVRQLSIHWKRGGPVWLRLAIWTLGVFGSPKMRPVFRLARKRYDRVPKDITKTKFEIPDLQEITNSLAADQPQAKTEFAS
ncbi:MAG: PHP domain-containing protein [Pyrinomonadaceae bacterium]